MLAFYCDGEDIKKFMGLVIGDSAFDGFELRSGEIVTRARFEIDGRLNRDFDGVEEERAFCLWGEIRPNVYDLIKGKKLPKLIKLVFALKEGEAEGLHPNLKAAFINAAYETAETGTRLTFTTGTAQKSFSLDKSSESLWEERVVEMFRSLGLVINILR